MASEISDDLIEDAFISDDEQDLLNEYEAGWGEAPSGQHASTNAVQHTAPRELQTSRRAAPAEASSVAECMPISAQYGNQSVGGFSAGTFPMSQTCDTASDPYADYLAAGEALKRQIALETGDRKSVV